MDPNATLVEIRALVALIEPDLRSTGSWVADEDAAARVFDNAERLCELTRALDGWLQRGGALPASWKR